MKTKEIDGFTYQVAVVSPRAGIKLSARVVNIIAPAIDKIPWEGKPTEEQVLQIIKAVMTSESLGDHLDFFVDQFAALTQVISLDGTRSFTLKDQFDAHFTGRQGAVFQWLFYAFQTNLSSFLGGTFDLGSYLAMLKERAAQS